MDSRRAFVAPRAAECILGAILPRAFRDSLLAEVADAASAPRRRWPRTWYWGQTLAACWPPTLIALHLEARRSMPSRDRYRSLLHDARHAARRLARDPWTTSIIVAALALGVGLNVTTLSLVDRLFLRGPEHIGDPKHLVRLYRTIDTPPAGVQTLPWIPYQTFLNLGAGMHTLDAVAAYRTRDAEVGDGRDARRLRVVDATGGYFSVLGVRPARGRLFAPDEDAAFAGPLAVVAEQYWRAQLGASPGVIGTTLRVGDVEHTIVGVAPAGFSGPENRRVDVWSLASSRVARTVNWTIVGRLHPGATPDAATAEADAVHRRTAESSPAWIRRASLRAAPIDRDESAHVPVETMIVRWFAGISAIILLITIANIVNLLLVRVARRRRELAVRVALGAGRARVARLVALEGTMLAVAGGAISLAVAALAEPVLRRSLFAGETAWSLSVLDPRVMLALAVVVLVTALLVGLVPALRAASPGVLAGIGRETQAGDEAASALRAGLTIAQSALTVVLLVGAGLFLTSIARVRAIDLGVDARRVLVVDARSARRIVPTAEGIRDGVAAERDTYRALLASVGALSGVEHAAITVGIPFDGGSFSSGIWVPGLDSIPSLPGGGPYISAVSSDYFATIGTRVLDGRAFTAADREGTEPVAIVGQTMARALWRGRDPLGRCLRAGAAAEPCARVVGVVADVHRVGLREQPSMQFYVPLGQHHGFAGARLLVRPAARGGVREPVIRDAVIATDPSLRAVEISPLAAALDGSMRPLRLGIVTFGLGGALALVVAVLGLYSLMAYMVAWRTREIGVRIAVGARTPDIIRLVVGGGARLTAIGVAIGIGLTFAGARWVEPQLFDTSAFDLRVRGAVAAIVLAVALLAGWIPARRASRIDPCEALRAE